MKFGRKELIFRSFSFFFLFISSINSSSSTKSQADSDQFANEIGANPYILKFEKLNYNQNDILHQSKRAKRSLDSQSQQTVPVYLSFNSHGIEFNLKLNPVRKSAFANDIVELNGGLKHANLNDYLNFYEGVLLDEPESSFASGTLIDGVFYGTIKSAKHGKFYIESTRRYNRTLAHTSHSIIYNEQNVQMDSHKMNMYKDLSLREKERNKRHLTNFKPSNNQSTQTNEKEDEETSCASSREDVRDWMRKQQEEMYKEKQRNEGFDPFSYIQSDEAIDLKEGYKKYSKEANTKKTKRQTSEAKRLEFPNKRTICNLYLRVDPQLHTEIYFNEGNRVRFQLLFFF